MGRGEGSAAIDFDFDVERFAFDDTLASYEPALTPELIERIKEEVYRASTWEPDQLKGLLLDPTFKSACAESPSDEAFAPLARNLLAYVLRSDMVTVRNYANRIAVATGALPATSDCIVTPEGWGSYCLREGSDATVTLCGKTLAKNYKTNYLRGTFNKKRALGSCQSCQQKVSQQETPQAFHAAWTPDPYELPYTYTDELEKEASKGIIRTLGSLSKDDDLKMKISRRAYDYLHSTIPDKMSRDIFALPPEERFERVFAVIANDERTTGAEVLNIREAIVSAYGEPAKLSWGDEKMVSECIKRSLVNGIGSDYSQRLRLSFYRQLLRRLWPDATYTF